MRVEDEMTKLCMSFYLLHVERIFSLEGSAEIAKSTCDIIDIHQTAGRSSKIGWVTSDDVKYNVHSMCVFAELLQKTSKVELHMKRRYQPAVALDYGA